MWRALNKILIQVETELSPSEVRDRFSSMVDDGLDVPRKIGAGFEEVSVMPLKGQSYKVQLEDTGPYPLVWKVEVVESVLGEGSKVCVTNRSVGLWVSIFVVLIVGIFAPLLWSGLGEAVYICWVLGLLALTTIAAGDVAPQMFEESQKIEAVLKAWLT